MENKILVSALQLHELLQENQCLVVDCRFDLTDAQKGRADWLTAHVPGARYAHLDHDLAGPIMADSGRHPLPDPAVFANFLATLGWTPGQLIVSYDDGSNAISARLWWMMRYFNQPAALLDGGFSAWVEAGLPVESGPVAVAATTVTQLAGDEGMTVSSLEVQSAIDSGRLNVLDARAEERFSGAVEPLDTRGGHIPGAMNRPFQLNLSDNGRFKSADVLHAEFDALLGGLEPGRIAHSCGSGVTACHNLFAMELAGFSPSVLYPGSWSEWIRDPARPIETGKSLSQT